MAEVGVNRLTDVHGSRLSSPLGFLLGVGDLRTADTSMTTEVLLAPQLAAPTGRMTHVLRVGTGCDRRVMQM
jgi:hypothetical protein